MVKKIAADFEAKSLAMAGELAAHIAAGKYTAMADMMTGNSVLILLKSRTVIRGPKAIAAYWRKMKAEGLIGIKLDVGENFLMPVDVKMAEPGGERTWAAFDMANYFFGTYELEFGTGPGLTGEIVFEPMHRLGCPRFLIAMIFTGL